ncbi:MAG: thymidine kinase [Elusimicrobiota bacterium]|jgi:thymidine kinase|nr:thymidine kinase [Elusimicrobiota bacterium]
MKSSKAKKTPYGAIEVICGCMFSGKSTELIRRIEVSRAAGQKVQVFNSTLDKRYAKKGICTHSLIMMDAVHVERAEEIPALVDRDTVVVALDEVNFFTNEIVNVAQGIAKRGLRVICCGLDLDYRGVPFESTARLLAVADTVDKLSARCTRCGKPARRTNRLVKVKSRIYVGGAHDYDARCVDCFKPK